MALRYNLPGLLSWVTRRESGGRVIFAVSREARYPHFGSDSGRPSDLGRILSEITVEVFKLRADIEVLHELLTPVYAKIMGVSDEEAARIFREVSDKGREVHFEEYRMMIDRITNRAE